MDFDRRFFSSYFRRNRLSLLIAIFFVLRITTCRSKNLMYSKSWIEDYRTLVKYGSPFQIVPTEYSLETHKNVVIQREDERYLDRGGYDYRESATLSKTSKVAVARNKGIEYLGRLVSDRIKVPKNVTHSLPSVRVDMILSEETFDESVNFIGLLDSPESDDYSGLSFSLRETKNWSISYEFSLCGNYGRRDMLSIGYVIIHRNEDFERKELSKLEAAVIDDYYFTVVLKSLETNNVIIADCDELNSRLPVFDNTLPGFYFPFVVYRRYVETLNAHARKNAFPPEIQIWKKRRDVCFETPINWERLPEIKIELFNRGNEAVEVTYPGSSLVKRYYATNFGRQTYCYIFAIRKASGDRVIFGRAAFEGLRLIFNRSGRSISLANNPCCDPGIKLRISRSTSHQSMSSCLPKNLRKTAVIHDTYWIWIVVMAVLLIATAGLLSVPRSLKRRSFGRPTIHVFVAQERKECREISTETTEREI